MEVLGDFNDWQEPGTSLSRGDTGIWEGLIDSARTGQGYKYSIENAGKRFQRNDPYAREVTNSVGHSIIRSDAFDWGSSEYALPDLNRLVIYELHLGTFNRSESDQVSGFDAALEKLRYLKELGINAVELMPVAEFAGDLSWGYNPAHPFAVEGAYGGPEAFKRFVKAAHENGIGVILDVVYNHFGPSDLDIWQFDGWSENEKGGIYFFNDDRSATPWGDTRPDYGRAEVSAYIHDNAKMWLEEYRVDGLRLDMTLYVRTLDGVQDIPEGYALVQSLNEMVHSNYPGKITIAEDLQNNDYLTRTQSEGGAGFSSQWDAKFVHPVREFLTTADDSERSIPALAEAVTFRYNEDPFQRVIYTESHDEVANGKARVPAEVEPHFQEGRFSQKLSCLGLSILMTSPGIPMLFQGQEFLTGGWFKDTEGLPWEKLDTLPGIHQLVKNLIGLRKNQHGASAGLSGPFVEVLVQDDELKMFAFARWGYDSKNSQSVVIINAKNEAQESYRVRFPAEGKWTLRFCSSGTIYGEEIGDWDSADCLAEKQEDSSISAEVHLGPYAALIFSQDS